MDFVIRYCEKVLPKRFRIFWEQTKSSPIAARLVHGSLWSLTGSVISRLLALAAAVVVARILGKAIYGELGIVQGTIGMFGTLAGFGMGTAATKFIAEFRNTDPMRAGKVIALSSLVSWCTGVTLGMALYILAPWLSESWLAAPEMIPYIRLSALLLVLNAVNGVQTGVLSGFEAFRKIAWVNGLTGLLNFPFVVGGAMLFELWGVVWGMIIAQAAGCLANVIIRRDEAARFHIPLVSWAMALSELSLLWRFALPATLGSLLFNPVDWVCMAMLARQPNGLEHVGTLNAANQWFGALLWLPYVMAQAVMPVLSERLGATDTNRSTKLLIISMKLSVVATLPFAIVGSLLSAQIMSAYGEDFVHDWPTLVVSLITCVIVAVQVPVGNMIAASGRMWLGLSMNLLWASVFVLVAWFSVQWGALGLVSARLIAYVVQGIWGCAYVLVLVRTLKKTSSVPN